MNQYKELYAAINEASVVLRAGSRLAEAINGIKKLPEMPTIVCLCGSTKFKDEFLEANRTLTHQGYIVLTVGSFPDRSLGQTSEDQLGEELKVKLDQLHKRKIDLADEILVLNVGGYIGSSTKGEIEYAIATGKPVSYLEFVP